MAGIRDSFASLQAFARKFEQLISSQRATTGWKTTPSARPPSRLHEWKPNGINPGALRSYVYAPQNLSDKPALVVALHGCGQTAAEYDYGTGWSTLADRHGFIVLYPEQQPANNPKSCFTWFLPTDTRRDHGEARSIHEMVQHAIEAFGVDRKKVYVTGLSAGGAMTSVMLATYPEVYTAGAIIAGLPYGAAGSVQEAFQAMFTDRQMPAATLGNDVRSASMHRGTWPRISVWHGTADAIVRPTNAEHVIQQWANVHGLPAAPTHEHTNERHSRRAWNDAEGNTLIEAFSIKGMAHGVPVAPGHGDNGCGHAGPFFIDVGLCSTRHIAGAWGLTGTPVDAEAPASRPNPAHGFAPPRSSTPEAPLDAIEAALKAAGLAPSAARSGIFADILPTIDAALKAAGLRRR